MAEELTLVKDLALILISAGLFTIVSKALGQPLVLGYIVAGILIGPHVDFYFGISSTEAVHQWSEIGIIFLMFGLGLEFSFKKLLKVGSSALITAVSEFLGLFMLGFVVAQAMSWSTMESIFLGGLLSMSSTSVIVKTFDELGLKKKPWASVVFGTIVIEDLIAMLLMVLLSSLAVSRQFAGTEMLLKLLRLGFVIVLWFLVGIFIIPTLLKRARKYLNEETLLVISIGLCFGMVAISESLGFSSALGAFVMGSILAETIENERIERVTTPIKNLFAAIFFVSVGMMISPAVILEHWGTVLVITAVVLLGDLFFVTIGALLSGKGLESAMHIGFSLTQLGEFGFIIASVGCTLGVMRDFIYPVIVAVSVITIFIAPYMMKAAGPTYKLLTRALPESFLSRFDHADNLGSDSASEKSTWHQLLKAYFLRIALYGVVLTAIDLVSLTYLGPLLLHFFPSCNAGLLSAICIVGTLLVMLPFIYGLSINTGNINGYVISLLKEKKSNALPILAMVLARSFIAVGFVLVVISKRAHLAGWAVATILFLGLVITMVARHFMRKYKSLLEDRFLSNYTERERLERNLAPVSTSLREKMRGYDVHLEPIVVSQNSRFAGSKLRDIPLRAETGANIIKISRGSRNIIIPSAEERIYPFDRLLAVGTSEQLEKLRGLVAKVNTEETDDSESDSEFDVVTMTLSKDSFLTDKVLKDTKLRDYRCMVISVLRGPDFITNPSPDLRFEAGDMVWIAGNCRKLPAS